MNQTSEGEKSIISSKAFIIAAIIDAASIFGFSAALISGDFALMTLAIMILFPLSLGLTSFMFSSYRSPAVLLPVLVSAAGAAVYGADIAFVGITVSVITALSALITLFLLKNFDPFTSKVWIVLLLTALIAGVFAFLLNSVYGDVMTGVDTVTANVGDNVGEAFDAYSELYEQSTGKSLGISGTQLGEVTVEYLRTMIPSALTISAMIITYITYGFFILAARINGVLRKLFVKASVPPVPLAVIYIVSLVVYYISGILPEIVGMAAANLCAIFSLLFTVESFRIMITMVKLGTGRKGKVIPVVLFIILLLVFTSALPVVAAVVIINSALRRRRNKRNSQNDM